MQSTDILLVASDQLFREGLKRLLVGSDFSIMAEAIDIAEGIAKVEAGCRPALAVLEFESANQVSGLRQWRERFADMKLVVLAAGTRDVFDLTRCFEAGADAYLLKTISTEALTQSMALVLMGEKVFPTRLAAMLTTAEAASPGPSPAALDGMSERECQILRCLVTGQSNKAIARMLNITEATVKVHLKNASKKISASNRTQAAIWALYNGLSSETPAPP